LLMILLNMMGSIWNVVGEFGDIDADVQVSWSQAYLGDTLRYGGVDGVLSYYMASFYYATMTCTTIGYGDVTAQTTVERSVSSFFMLVGAALYGYVIGIIVNVVEASEEGNKVFSKTLDTLNKFIKDERMPAPLARELRSFLVDSRSLIQSENRNVFLKRLSDKLQADLADCVYGPFFRSIPSLKNAGSLFIGSLAGKLTPVAFGSREKLIRNHEIAGESKMYLINRGLVGSRGRVLRKGDVVGSDIICPKLERNYSAETLTHVHTMTLESKDLHQLLSLRQFSVLKNVTRRYSLWMYLKVMFVDLGRRIRRVKDYAKQLSVSLKLGEGAKTEIQVVFLQDNIFVHSAASALDEDNHSSLFDVATVLEELKRVGKMLADRFRAGEDVPEKYVFKPTASTSIGSSNPTNRLTSSNARLTSRQVSERMLSGLERLEGIVKLIKAGVEQAGN